MHALEDQAFFLAAKLKPIVSAFYARRRQILKFVEMQGKAHNEAMLHNFAAKKVIVP